MLLAKGTNTALSFVVAIFRRGPPFHIRTVALASLSVLVSLFLEFTRFLSARRTCEFGTHGRRCSFNSCLRILLSGQDAYSCSIDGEATVPLMLLLLVKPWVSPTLPSSLCTMIRDRDSWELPPIT